MGLNLKSTTKLNKWSSYKILFANNAGAVNLRSVFKNEVTVYRNNMVAIGKVVERANADVKGITDGKKLAKKKASKSIEDITKNAFSFASKYKLIELKKQMKNGTSSKLYKEKDENFISKCNNINKTLIDILAEYTAAADYFTASELADAMLLVEDFENNTGVWAVAIADINSAKREFEKKWVPKMGDSLDVLEGLLPGGIVSSFPAFAKSFRRLKKLVNKGVKNQGLMVAMRDAETGELFVGNGRMETLNYAYGGKQKVGLTDSSGLFKRMKLNVGVWKFMFSAEGFVSQIIEIKISKKKVVKVSVKMVKEVVSC